MKTKLFIIACILLAVSCVPTRVTPKDDFKKSTTLSDLNTPKLDLYIKANDWMVDTFNSPESVIEFTDKESGTILGKYLAYGAESTDYTVDTRTFAKIDVRVKEDAAKIEISLLNDVRTYNKAQEDEIHKKLDNIILSFKERMQSSENDW